MSEGFHEGTRPRGLRILAGILSLGAAVVSTMGGAAQAASTQAVSNPIETVVVTAEKRAQNINKVPDAVQAISGYQLQTQGIRDLKTALALIPGASITGETSQGTQTFQLRGVATGDVNGDATVASYLDDFAFSIPGVPFVAPTDLFDVNRVEVLEGPQGTLYGSNSLGGLIKVVTNDPDLNHYDALVSGSFGAVRAHGYNYSADLMVNIPLIPGQLAVRGVISSKHLSGDATVPHLGIRNGNNDDTITGRVKVLWHPTSRFSFLGSFWRFDDRQDFTNRVDHVHPVQIADVGVGNSPTAFSLYTGKFTYDFDWATLTSMSGYMDRHNNLKALGCQVDTCFDARIPERSTSFVQEVRLTSRGHGPFQWIGGLFYQYGTNFSDTFFKLTSLFTDGISDQKSIQYAAYGQASYSLWHGLVVPLIGLRYSAIRQKLEQNSTTTISTVPPTVLTSSNTVGGKNYHLNPRFNISVYPTKQGMVYVNVAQGFRPGALQTGAEVASLQAVTGVTTAEQLKTDSLWSYELGTKWTLLDDSLNLAASVYEIDWNQAQFQTGISGISGIINLGNVRGHGIELQASYQTPIRGLSLQFAGAWNSTKVYDINPKISAALPFLHNGAQVPPVPKDNMALIVNYNRDLGFHDLEFISDFRYEYRDREMDLSTGRKSGIINILSADVGVENDRYQIQAFVDNMLNDQGPLIWEEGRMLVPRPFTIGLRFSFHPDLQ
ncbi:MAG: TonB-dependent receptor [Alphaproteobacteria bacterium]|nr:TonB-dependent receptor [Alphaproteobacteria bacterium]